MDFTPSELALIEHLVRKDWKFNKDFDKTHKMKSTVTDQEFNILKKINKPYAFKVCEICGDTYMSIYEGADPNTCAHCNPIREEEDDNE